MADENTEPVNPSAIKIAMDFINEHIVFLRTRKTPTIEHLFSLAKTVMKKKKLDCMVIDPYNMIDNPRDPRITETESINKFLVKIKNFCSKYDVHIFIVAHPRKLMKLKSGNYQPAVAYDISGSAHWFNQADYIFSVWRDLVEKDNPVKTFVQKVRYRHLGTTGCAKLVFDHSSGRYDDYHDPREYPIY